MGDNRACEWKDGLTMRRRSGRWRQSGCRRRFGRVGTAALLPTSSRARFNDTHGRGRAHSAHNAFEAETRCGEKTSELALCALAPPWRHRQHLEIEQERDLGLAVLRALG